MAASIPARVSYWLCRPTLWCSALLLAWWQLPVPNGGSFCWAGDKWQNAAFLECLLSDTAPDFSTSRTGQSFAQKSIGFASEQSKSGYEFWDVSLFVPSQWVINIFTNHLSPIFAWLLSQNARDLKASPHPWVTVAGRLVTSRAVRNWEAFWNWIGLESWQSQGINLCGFWCMLCSLVIGDAAYMLMPLFC